MAAEAPGAAWTTARSALGVGGRLTRGDRLPAPGAFVAFRPWRCAAYHPGKAPLTRADVEHVAHLARLGLAGEEIARLEGQLNHILDQYAKLAELDTDAIPPTAQVIELENILREDVAGPSLPADAVLANAPERDGDFFVVPAILGGD